MENAEAEDTEFLGKVSIKTVMRKSYNRMVGEDIWLRQRCNNETTPLYVHKALCTASKKILWLTSLWQIGIKVFPDFVRCATM